MTTEEAQAWCAAHAVRVQFTTDRYTIWIPTENEDETTLTRVTGNLSSFGPDVAVIAAAYEAENVPRWLQLVDEASYPATLVLIALAVGTLISLFAFKASHSWFEGFLILFAGPVLLYWFWPSEVWENRKESWWGGLRLGMLPAVLGLSAYCAWRILVFLYGPLV